MKNRTLHIIPVMAFCLAGAFSCKKFVEKVKTQAAENVITSGTWRVSRYVAGDSDVTAEFNNYKFQFLDNDSVDGISDSGTRSGTWSADILAKTIVAYFPGNQLPVSRLNYTWKIKDSYKDSVSANTQVDSILYRLELHKN